MISAPSVVSALFFYTLALLAVCVVHKLCPSLLKHGGAFIFLSMAAVATLRLFLPLEIPANHLIRSRNLLGGPVRLIRTYPAVANFLLVVWIGGGIRSAYKTVRELLDTKKTIDNYTPDDCEHAQEIAKRLSINYPVKVSRDVKMAYAAEIFSHTIFLPVLDLPESEIGLILRHEAQHLRSHDFIVKLLFRLLLVVMWWNPIAHWFWHILDDLLELRCDAKLTAHMSAQERDEYRAMLEGLAKVAAGDEMLSPLVVDELFVASREEFMDQRLKIIDEGTGEPPRIAIIAAWCLAVVLFCASYLVIFQPEIDPPAESFEQTSKIYYEENYDDQAIEDGAYEVLIFKESDGRYQLFVNYVFSGYLTEDEINSENYCNYPIFEEEE